MKFSFFKAAVKFAYFVLALSKVRWLESPLETNFNSSVSDHLEVSFGKMFDLNFTFIRQLKVPSWRSILVLAMTDHSCKAANSISGLWQGHFAA